MADDLKYPGGPLGPGASQTTIGGTHNVSTKIDPDRALTGNYTPIPGDAMPAPGGAPYLPKN
jgi:hypothetical protein